MAGKDTLLLIAQRVEGRRMSGLTDLGSMFGWGGRGGAAPHLSPRIRSGTTPSPAKGEGWAMETSGVEPIDVR